MGLRILIVDGNDNVAHRIEELIVFSPDILTEAYLQSFPEKVYKARSSNGVVEETYCLIHSQPSTLGATKDQQQSGAAWWSPRAAAVS
ncbi:unnamed protein product [Acanthoscelides obtectus]|uniref:Uncharacterized protein n=1 Tax=Acanthoscelides obtectus TaxID=200917 RepID=A0A9P0PZE1_ACAOB|nr:unnamed protein product [Acanthoscelides obtectus]CAK1632812.1 hypothetical protein AOBTE_LOCUS7739 [Acanthoscelides obtectus]